MNYLAPLLNNASLSTRWTELLYHADEFIYAGKKWDEYDGTFLEFPEGSDARPQKRSLYFHYWMCLVKSYRELIPGGKMSVWE